MANKITFTQEQLNEMVQLHSEGMLNRELAQYFNVSRSTIDRRLADMNVISRHPWVTFEREQEAIALYQKYQNLRTVGRKVHMNGETVKRILIKNGIKVLNGSEVKQTCHVDESYFSIIDSSRKSYYLGLLSADGCASEKNHSIILSLQAQDKAIIDSFNRDIKSDYKIRFIEMSKKNVNWKDQYSLCISNKIFYDNAVALGIVPNKSLILQFPDFLEEEFYPSFLLGYMDGDGSIGKKECRCNFVSTESFCRRASEIIQSKLGVHCSIINKRDNKTTTRTLSIAGRNQVKKYLDWLYSNSDIWLERKYQIYKEKYCF